MKKISLLTIAIVSLTCTGAFAYTDSNFDMMEGRKFFEILEHAVSDNPVSRARAEREAKNRALDELNARNERIEESVKVELDKQPMLGRVSECSTFIKTTRYQAAPLHVRLIDLVANNNNGGKLTEMQLSVLTDGQRKVAQGWVDYAKRVHRTEFTGLFSPASCTGRQDGMTDAKAATQIKALKQILQRVERYNYNAI